MKKIWKVSTKNSTVWKLIQALNTFVDKKFKIFVSVVWNYYTQGLKWSLGLETSGYLMKSLDEFQRSHNFWNLSLLASWNSLPKKYRSKGDKKFIPRLCSENWKSYLPYPPAKPANGKQEVYLCWTKHIDLLYPYCVDYENYFHSWTKHIETHRNMTLKYEEEVWEEKILGTENIISTRNSFSEIL